VVVDEGIGPDGGKQLVAAADLSGPLREVDEQFEGLGRQDHFGRPLPESSLGDVESKIADSQHHA